MTSEEAAPPTAEPPRGPPLCAADQKFCCPGHKSATQPNPPESPIFIPHFYPYIISHHVSSIHPFSHRRSSAALPVYLTPIGYQRVFKNGSTELFDCADRYQCVAKDDKCTA